MFVKYNQAVRGRTSPAWAAKWMEELNQVRGPAV